MNPLLTKKLEKGVKTVISTDFCLTTSELIRCLDLPMPPTEMQIMPQLDHEGQLTAIHFKWLLEGGDNE